MGCPPGQFLCVVSGQCIKEKAKCDGHRDCSDGSDEAPGDEECRGESAQGYNGPW